MIMSALVHAAKRAVGIRPQPRRTLFDAARERAKMVRPSIQPTPPTIKQPVPHVLTFNSLSSFARTYRNPDEAWRNSQRDAKYMRNDLLVMECLEARQRAVALLPWHLAPEDPKDPAQVEAVRMLTAILKRTPRFTEMRRNLQEAIWYGRHAVQFETGELYVDGTSCHGVTDWSPINGDKLAFKWDGQLGIRVGYSNAKEIEVGGSRRQIELVPDYNRAYFLTPDERARVIVHRHMIEDADFTDPLAAGSVHGVGIRSRIYWTWFQKQAVLAMLMEYLERSALGYEIATFPWGNDQAEAKMREAMENRIGNGRNIILVPVMPDQSELFKIQHIEPGLQGAELINTLVHQHYGWQIKRYTLGQILSTEPEGSGLGSSGLSDLHESSLRSVIEYDARNVEESITLQLVAHLQRQNRHRLPASAARAHIRFVIDTESEDMGDSLDAMQKAWQMNLPIPEEPVYKLLGLSKPTADDRTLPGPNSQTQGEAGSPQQPRTMLDRVRQMLPFRLAA